MPCIFAASQMVLEKLNCCKTGEICRGVNLVFTAQNGEKLHVAFWWMSEFVVGTVLLNVFQWPVNFGGHENSALLGSQMPYCSWESPQWSFEWESPQGPFNIEWETKKVININVDTCKVSREKESKFYFGMAIVNQ